MSQETEERKQIGGQTLPSNDVGRRQRPLRRWLGPSIALIAVAALLVSGIWSRVRARTTLKAETAQVALTAVSVVTPKQTAPAKANLELASITKSRYQGLLKSNAVSQQDVDNAVGTYNANKAIVEADQAAVEQYTALVSFERVYAPFDGVVTTRNTDVGDLINSGSSGGVKTDLFHIAQPGKLRVYVNVPEEYSRGVKVGMTADLSLAEFPGRRFRGKLVRTADAITVTTRTLLIEIDVDNPTGTLLTGSYAEVHLAVPAQS